ncbi:hypothetical protein [Actinoplanes sp. CA-252034]|uniref:hypothetical protein n=1 Tax=Actinoplanes sp. CA-252034 TaxID=3239906 RepID=UPI003D98E5AA
MPRPTVISLEWDHCYESALVDRSPGIDAVVCLPPAGLGLSPALARRLEAWLDDQEAASGHVVRGEPETDETRAEDARLDRRLLDLAYAVQHELGAYVEVLIRGEPLAGRHRR